MKIKLFFLQFCNITTQIFSHTLLTTSFANYFLMFSLLFRKPVPPFFPLVLPFYLFLPIFHFFISLWKLASDQKRIFCVQKDDFQVSIHYPFSLFICNKKFSHINRFHKIPLTLLRITCLKMEESNFFILGNIFLLYKIMYIYISVFCNLFMKIIRWKLLEIIVFKM